jgi:molybdenum cofactor cytidylyltransferase
MKIATIVLAAGGSSRMAGGPKQLLKSQGRTLIRRAAESALEVDRGPVIVVLGDRSETIAPELRGLPLITEINHNWNAGIGSSIKAGLTRALRADPEIDAVVIVLADQPFVSASHLKRLCEVFSEERCSVVASGYADTAGVPALFASDVFNALSEIPDDRGAKFLLKEKARIRTIALSEAAAADIDTPQDAAAYLDAQ